MAQETNQTQAPLLCSTGCGFYGNPRTNGMCSICYKDFLQRQNTNGRVAESVSVPAASSSLSSLDESLSAPSSRVSPVSTLEQSSSQSLVKPAEVTQVEDVSAKDEAKTQGASCSAAVASVQQNHPLRAGGSVEASASRGKRKLDEILQLDGESASGSDAPSQPPADESGKPKPRKNRCYTCRKKVGLTGFDCRCGNLFCGVHRYSDIHNCSFDYKADAAEKIRKENPVVVGEKIAKI